MGKKNPDVDAFLKDSKQWRAELTKLRAIALDCNLTEELKWRAPCYTFGGSNIAILGGFKDNCVLSFFKGALLSDPQKILVKPGENTQAARVVRFTSVEEIKQLEQVLKAYILEAIQVEDAGLKVEFDKTPEPIPEELQQKFEELPKFEKAFDALTPGRQRAYIMFFTGAKQSATRTARIEKYIPQILAGKGMNDCTCGLSKKMPGCDGSHKSLQK